MGFIFVGEGLASRLEKAARGSERRDGFEPYSRAVQERNAPLVLRTDARLCRATAGATVVRLADKRACRLGFARLSAPLGAGFKALLCFEKQKWIPEMGIRI